MMLYPKSRQKFSTATFQRPGAEYRGCPFWSWNNTLDREQLLRQLSYFEQMGMGGPTIHCRTGLGTPYLGKQFMDIVRACTDAAKNRGMLTWLYDEDRWPSGFAGGLVTKEKRYRLRHLLFTPRPYNGRKVSVPVISGAWTGRTENGRLLAAYDVTLASDGSLAGYTRVAPINATTRSPKGARRWYAYLETAEPTSWFNFQTYVDTLNPKAIERFIETTHEAYKKAVGDEFGKSVPAIFTDEPQFARKGMLREAAADSDVMMPWTPDFAETFRAAWGEDILDDLPELFWRLPARRASVMRYRYHDHVAERFAAAFADTIGAWCQRHNIALTGHMMEEPTLSSQTHSLGEAMRSYRGFHLPGIDMLCNWPEYTTAKQAQSAVHQYGREGMLSELYGVTGWHFDFVGHKNQGDWQAALGVTIRVHHLAWVSMAGEAKRDYPASIFYQSPWWKEYRTVEDHFARVNVALTRGTPLVRIPADAPLVDVRNRRDACIEIGRIVIVGCFMPQGAYPILAINGEHGSCKSTTTRLLRELIDPSKAGIRAEPHSDRDLMIAARNSFVLSFDNISYLQQWLSDGLCRLSTGAGFATRELFTNSEEMLIEVRRPVMLNGIEELAAAPDLADRTLPVTLEKLTGPRKTEHEVLGQFKALKPLILGTLYDAVSVALRNQANVQLKELPRMADFAKWATAAEPGFGLASGSFMKAHEMSRDEADAVLMDSCVIWGPLMEVINRNPRWTGNFTALLTAINGRVLEESRRKKAWPQNPRALSAILSRIAPVLRRHQILVLRGEKSTDKERRRIVHIHDMRIPVVNPFETKAA